jgi:hypothetical protein
MMIHLRSGVTLDLPKGLGPLTNTNNFGGLRFMSGLRTSAWGYGSSSQLPLRQ